MLQSKPGTQRVPEVRLSDLYADQREAHIAA
jgi:hypothetical protein